MNSFYGGPAGQDFEVREKFSTFKFLLADIDDGWKSPIAVGEYVMISYGHPTDPGYQGFYDLDRKNSELPEEKRRNWNSTLWQKVYEEDTVEDIDEDKNIHYAVTKSSTGINYKFITSCTGNTPVISVTTPARVLDADEEPKVNTDLSNPDLPVISFELPRSQILSMLGFEKKHANEDPEIIFDSKTNVNNPTI